MKKEEYKPPLLYRIMSSEDQLKQAKVPVSQDVSLMHMKHKKNDILKPLNKKIKKYNRIIGSKLKMILNTSNIIRRAKENSSDLKDIIIELDKSHINNIIKYTECKKNTEETKNIILNMKNLERGEENKNNLKNKNDSNTNNNIKNENNKSTIADEMSSEKMHKLLSDNVLLMVKKKEIFSYYLIKNKYHVFNEEKKIRYIDKIREMLEIKQIQANNLLDEREKKAKIQNNKFFINHKKRLKIENQENYNKLSEKMRQENESSLKSIKDTNATLEQLNNNKSYLDEDIKLKYDHSLPSIINDKINKKKLMIRKLTEMYNNRTDRTKCESNNISMDNIRIKNYLNSSQKNDYMELLKNKENKTKKSIVNLRRLTRTQNSTNIPRQFINKKVIKKVKLNEQNISNSNSIDESMDKDLVNKRMTSVYEEIKGNNILKKKDQGFMKTYFENKKMKLNKKPRQAVTIMSNSLSRINEVDITKKLKKIHGVHIPEKYSQYFDRIESMNNGAYLTKCKIIDSLCKVKMDT